jgi:7,8-dihydropterin-6-yl-methyl-4-(beta-D-ribofuranosyl)aminobenzene 5'-phosphate synthase
MTITVLSENTSASEALRSEHGLSLFIETDNHRLLFDTGASSLFAENAEKLGVDLASADAAVISHGHYDHGGGLPAFLRINGRAKIYLNRKAFGKYYAERPGGRYEYIGLPESLAPNARFAFCGDRCGIDGELELFSGVCGEAFVPSGNSTLFVREGDAFRPDDFAHEQNLIITFAGKTLLIAGCAHRGIINIVERFQAEKGRAPDVVIGGFHLYNHGTKTSEAPEIVDAIGGRLLDTGSRYYTCHCTGAEAYVRLKAVMGDRIGYLAAGDRLEL